MSTYIVTGQGVNIWGSSGNFHCQAQVTVTPNSSTRKFTVKVSGVRAYADYWDFGCHYDITVSGNASGTGGTTVTDVHNTESSGYNSYCGWIPRSGYYSTNVSKVFDYNADGSAPAVYIKVACYNKNVLQISTGQYKYVYCSLNQNISSQISKEDGISPTAPKITLTSGNYGPTYISWSATSDVTVQDWQYSLDGGSWTNCTKSTTVKNLESSNHSVKVRATRVVSSTGKSIKGVSNTVTFDCRLPVISSATATPTSQSKANLSFKCSLPCSIYWNNVYIGKTTSNNQTFTKSVDIVAARTTNTLKVERTSNSLLKASTSIVTDATIPTLTATYSVSGTSVTINATCTAACDTSGWQVFLNGVETAFTRNRQVTSTTLRGTFDNLTPGSTYTLKITAVKAGTTIKVSSPTYTFTLEGGAYINTPNGLLPATVWVNTTGTPEGWKRVEPYVYNGTSWVKCN